MVVALLYCSELTHSVQMGREQQWQNLPCRTEQWWHGFFPGWWRWPPAITSDSSSRDLSGKFLQCGFLVTCSFGAWICAQVFVCVHSSVSSKLLCCSTKRHTVGPSQHPWELLAGNTTSINNQRFPTSQNRKMAQISHHVFFFFKGACDWMNPCFLVSAIGSVYTVCTDVQNQPQVRSARAGTRPCQSRSAEL